MRRLVAGTFLALVPLLAAPALPGVQAAEPDHRAQLVKLRVFAGGAAGEATYDVLCQVDEGSATVSLGLHQGGKQYIARGKVTPVPCTGQVERVVVAVQSDGSASLRRIEPGAATVELVFMQVGESCDTCFDELTSSPATVVQKPFVAPYDQDLGATLTLVRSRLTAAGKVRVVYDLTCDGARSTPSPVRTTLTQVDPRGRLVLGVASKPVGGDVECDATPQRYRLLVEATRGRFGPGTSFVGTTFGSAYEWGVYADDQHPLTLAPRP